MAKKKAAAKEVERKVLSNGVILIKYDDGSYAFLTPISAEDAEEIFGGESEDSDDEDEDDDGDPEYDGVIYDATCPVCGEEISFDEDTLAEGSIECPNCGETICVDDGILEDGSIDCPNCGTLLEFDFDDDCCCGDDDCDCDHDD